MALSDLTNMVAYWRGNAHAGTIEDVHGANDLTFSVAEKGGGAARFINANADYLFAADNAALSTGDVDFAWAGWVYFDTLPASGAGHRLIVHKGVETGTVNLEYSLWFRAVTQRLRFEVSSGAAVTAVEWSSAPSANTWYFVYAYHDSVNDLIGISVDDAAAVTAAHSAGAQDSAYDLYIGRSYDGIATNYHDGFLGTWGFWNGGLPSGATLTSIYNSGNGKAFADLSAGEKTNLAAWWDMSEPQGGRLDSVGASHLVDGTAQNGRIGNTDANVLKALYFKSNKASIADNASMSTGDVDFGFAGWLYISSKGANAPVVFSKGTNATAANYEYVFYYNGTNLRLAVSNGTTATGVNSSATISTGVWYFVYAYHDSVNNVIGISIDNGTAATAAHSAGSQDSAHAFNFGFWDAASVSGYEYLNGYLQGWAFWKGGLPTSGELSEMWNRGLGLDHPFTGVQIDNVGTLVTNDAHDNNTQNQAAYRSQALAQVTLSATTYETIAYWSDAASPVLTIATRTAGGSWTAYGTGVTLTGNDNHDTIAIGIDPDGYIHVSYDMHAEALKYARSNAAIDTWTGTLTTGLSMLGTNETQVTYPTFINDASGNLYFIFRHGISGDGNLYFYAYTHGTTTWAAATGTSTAGLLINGGSSNVSPYWSQAPVFDDSGDLHLAWIWATSIGANLYDLAYVKWNGTTFEQADGTAQTVPITPSNCETVVDTSNTGLQLLAWPAVDADGSGYPHLAYVTPDSSGAMQIYHKRHNGTSWQSTVAVTTGGARRIRNDGLPSLLADGVPRLVMDRSTGDAYVLFYGYGEGTGLFYYQSSDYSTWVKTTITTTQLGVWQPNYNRAYWDTNQILQLPLAPSMGFSTNGYPVRILTHEPTPTGTPPGGGDYVPRHGAVMLGAWAMV
jgi:hypothetical protein